MTVCEVYAAIYYISTKAIGYVCIAGKRTFLSSFFCRRQPEVLTAIGRGVPLLFRFLNALSYERSQALCIRLL
jgi:hypothetical protein